MDDRVFHSSAFIRNYRASCFVRRVTVRQVDTGGQTDIGPREDGLPYHNVDCFLGVISWIWAPLESMLDLLVIVGRHDLRCNMAE